MVVHGVFLMDLKHIIQLFQRIGKAGSFIEKINLELKQNNFLNDFYSKDEKKSAANKT